MSSFTFYTLSTFLLLVSKILNSELLHAMQYFYTVSLLLKESEHYVPHYTVKTTDVAFSSVVECE